MPSRAQIFTVSMSLALGALAPSGCALRASSPYQPLEGEARSSLEAQRLTSEASVALGESDSPTPQQLAEAERLLRAALTADLYHGPAHNNLGVVFVHQFKLYEAASEFEWARKLLPGNPSPRMNLGLVLETAERSDDAIEAYSSALQAERKHIPSVQALARLQLRRSRADERTTGFLKLISVRGDTQEWRDWARLQLAARHEP